MNDELSIKELYKEYWNYMIRKDIDGLERIMAKDYHLIHMTGNKQSAEEFLKGLADGTFNYYSANHDDIQVQISGDIATMIGKSQVVAAVYGGGKNRWFLRGDFTLRKETDTWKLTSSKASTY